MENKKESKIPHCLILPFPLQGHINPMLQFSKRLQHKGKTQITLAITKHFLKTAQDLPSFPVEPFSDGFDDGGADKVGPMECYTRCWEVGSQSLYQLLEKLRVSGHGVDCLIYDPFYPWAFDVAKRFGVKVAMFFTQSNCVNNIYFHVYKGLLKVPLVEKEVRVGGLPVLKGSDTPSFVGEYELDVERSEMMVKQFRNVEMVDWVLVNTFHELEKEVCDWMAKFLPMRTIGPTIPSMYLEKRLLDDNQYSLNAFKPITDPCTKWLNNQRSRSIVYISFGSFAQLGIKQMQELALALKKTNLNFLWVVRASEEAKLPENYRDEINYERGLIVTWCHQLDVLSHDAIGCFVTHCGWNSTLEALASGVPMVAVPQWSDQSTNAKFVADVWKTGIRAEKNKDGIVNEGEIVRCVKRVMEGGTGEEIRRRAIKWKKLAREALDEGGSSDANIEEFVCALMKCES